MTMKQSHKFAVGVIASLGLGVAVATAYANPGQMGGGMGPQGGAQHGAKGGMHGAKGGMQHRMQGGQDSARGHRTAGQGVGAQLMTPEERTALREKMRNATPEERQQIATATRAEMQKRAQEKGITLPEHHGRGHGNTPQAADKTEQAQ
jgi:hypothetical protein